MRVATASLEYGSSRRIGSPQPPRRPRGSQARTFRNAFVATDRDGSQYSSDFNEIFGKKEKEEEHNTIDNDRGCDILNRSEEMFQIHTRGIYLFVSFKTCVNIRLILNTFNIC